MTRSGVMVEPNANHADADCFRPTVLPDRPPPLLDRRTVRVLHQAVRAALLLRAGSTTDWSWPRHSELQFLRAARGHHVSGVIAPFGRELGLPAELARALNADADRHVLTALAHAGFLRTVHRNLSAAGIPVLFLKGLAVEAQTVRRLGERSSGDIDILVPREHVATAIAALSPVWRLPDGYPSPAPTWSWRHWQRWGSELPLSGPVTVDLHWQLRGGRAHLRDFARVWDARTEVDIAGHPVPTLSAAHALEHACRHAQHDRWRILRSLVDIHLLLDLVPAHSGASDRQSVSARSIGIVSRSIGLPDGWHAPLPSAHDWYATLDEQRHVGSHADRNSRLTRPAYLRRMISRVSPDNRRALHDALGLLWVISMPPPHQLGAITTPSTIKGVFQGMQRRFRYERARRPARHSTS